MKEVTQQFLCNLKQTEGHAVMDFICFFGGKALLAMAGVSPDHGGWFGDLMFNWGWLILICWRIVNAGLDTYKRLRDIRKPEWKTNVAPLIKAQAVRNRKLPLHKKIFNFISNLWK